MSSEPHNQLQAVRQHVFANRDDVPEHIAQVAGDRDFLDRVGDLAALHPETSGGVQIVASDEVDAVWPSNSVTIRPRPIFFGGSRKSRLPGWTIGWWQPPVLPSGLQAELARLVGAQDVALQAAVGDHLPKYPTHWFSVNRILDRTSSRTEWSWLEHRFSDKRFLRK